MTEVLFFAEASFLEERKGGGKKKRKREKGRKREEEEKQRTGERGEGSDHWHIEVIMFYHDS